MLTEEPNFDIEPGPLELLKITVMHGANYFSGGPVCVFRIDLGDYDEVFTNEIEGFYDKLKTALPSLVEHHCSPGKRGGFFQRVRRGTLLGHVTEHVAIELQTLAGMDVAYGKTRSTTEQGVYNVVFRFFDEVAGVCAGRAALNLVNALLEDRDFEIDRVVDMLVEIRERRMLGPSTQAIVDEATSRGIPCLRLDAYNLVQLGTGRHHKRIRATVTSDTSSIAVETAADKALTNRVLADAGIPVPATTVVTTAEEAVRCLRSRGPALVVKPCDGHLGRGVSLGVAEAEVMVRAFARGAEHDQRVLVQPMVPGDTFRALVINYRMEAAARLAPPRIVGDGQRTVNELVVELNADPRRGVGDKALLTLVELDEQSRQLLADRGYDPETVLPQGEVFVLKTSSNLRLGGEAHDVSDTVHPMNRYLVERAARVMGLNVAGVDLIATTLEESILETGGVVVEVNAAPDFRPHLSPAEGEGRNVTEPLVSMLFPNGVTSRVPVFSVTGTAGKTTTVNLLAHCLWQVGLTAGVTTTEGLFVSDRRLMKGDMTYPEHVGLVLKDPTIDCAVLETSREGILRRGLGYDYADVGIVLNVYDDHVGSDDITLLEDLAYAKSVVAEQVHEHGCAVLNADQELVIEMRERVASRLALFSATADNPEVRDHVDGGGLAAVVDGDRVTILDGLERIEVLDLADIPLSHGGRARINLDNILAATAALYAHGIAVDAIRRGLSNFRADPEMLPGRMNLFHLKDFDVLLDYAHNRATFERLRDYLDHFPERKLGVLDAPGDRSDDEIRGLGEMAAETYDELFLYEDPDRRGRGDGEIVALLREGALAAELAADRVHTFDAPQQAWSAALERGEPGALVVILTERSEEALRLLATAARR